MSVVTIAPPTTNQVLLTAEEFTTQYANRRAELVKGIVKELPVPTPKHGKVRLTIGRLIGNYAADYDCGHVMSNDSWIRTRRNLDTVRGADICYYSYERLPRGEISEGLLETVPELVVEVRSPSDRWTEIFAKVIEYLEAGVKVVILLDPKSETASVYRDTEIQQIFHNRDELTIPDVLPGFSVAVNKLFA